MGYLAIIYVLFWIVACAGYVMGKHHGLSLVCDEKDERGQHVLQRITVIGGVSTDVRVMVDRHNAIILKLCNR